MIKAKVMAIILALSLALVPTSHVLANTPTVCENPVSVTNPCVGVLLPPEAAASGLRCLQVDVPRLMLDLEREKELFTLRIDTMQLIINQEKS